MLLNINFVEVKLSMCSWTHYRSLEVAEQYKYRYLMLLLVI